MTARPPEHASALHRAHHTPEAPRAIGPYSQARVVAAGGVEWIFTAGQVGLVPQSGQLAGPGIAEQTRQTLANLRAVLTSAGFTFADVVKSTVFLADFADFEVMNGIYAEVVGEAPPARSTVQVAQLPRQARIEIEMVAVRPLA